MKTKKAKFDPYPWFIVLIFYLFTIIIMLYLYSKIPKGVTFAIGYVMRKQEFFQILLLIITAFLLTPMVWGEWRYKKAIKNNEREIRVTLNIFKIRPIERAYYILAEDFRMFVAINSILYASYILTIYVYFTVAKILSWDISYWYNPKAGFQLNFIFFLAPILAITTALFYVAHYYDKKANKPNT